MKTFNNSVALGLPLHHLDLLQSAHDYAVNPELPCAYRIGVGSKSADVPMRVLGHANVLARTIRLAKTDRVGSQTRIEIFNSATKLGVTDSSIIVTQPLALAVALRKAGVNNPITVTAANPNNEVPEYLDFELSEPLLNWIDNAGGDVQYAIEHAAPSMFGDLGDSDQRQLNITLGSRPEGTFWAIRCVIRRAARHSGIAVNPALAFILPAARVPWYKPTPIEPMMAGIRDAEQALLDLKRASNPGTAGNSGLKTEYRATKAFVQKHGLIDLPNLVQAPSALADTANTAGITIAASISRHIS